MFYREWAVIVEIERHPEIARRLHAAEQALMSDDRITAALGRACGPKPGAGSWLRTSRVEHHHRCGQPALCLVAGNHFAQPSRPR
jgi:hypothetical protein